MQRPAPPEDEATRAAAVRDLELMYTPSEERFDRITRLARRLLGTPVALLTLVGDDMQYFKSSQGWNETETPRDLSFCGHTILEERAFVVNDTLADERFADNPLVTGESAIPVRFYAGYPVHARDGSRVGSICLIDHEPRAFSEADAQTLKDLAALVDSELQHDKTAARQSALVRERDEFQRRALIDPLTRGWNRAAILDELASAVSTPGGDVGVAIVDIDHFKAINDTYGHPAGDAALAEIAARLRGAVRADDAVGRYGGEEFCVVLGDADHLTAATVAERMRLAIAERPVDLGTTTVSVTASIGCASAPGGRCSAEALVAAADDALYRAKHGGRNRVEMAADGAVRGDSSVWGP